MTTNMMNSRRAELSHTTSTVVAANASKGKAAVTPNGKNVKRGSFLSALLRSFAAVAC
jgi:hypothetical protein